MVFSVSKGGIYWICAFDQEKACVREEARGENGRESSVTLSQAVALKVANRLWYSKVAAKD